ncbi:sugar ABC transporter permease [Ruminococcus sp. NK3A76]|uniref:carbohydrate ABC transporter permease n=1 Tax=Ruminococcus sp. NK3A76 TaxID=877411 RepID=UPI00048BD7E6|nr:sugar ABC transporter permease [Ruminococcus sp. NK3A76]
MASSNKHKSISYAKWGYFFILPFFVVYAIFSLYPMFSTIRDSFYKKMTVGLIEYPEEFVGVNNYIDLFKEGDIFTYFGNTFIIWIIGFIPQIFIALLLASWFTDIRLKLKAQGFFKVVIYLPNIIMAAAVSMLFFSIFADSGPINDIYKDITGAEESYRFFAHVGSTRIVIALINFLMWFGNTTILLMAAIMGVDPALYEAAEIDGATPSQTFWQITIPSIRPILIYVLVTSLIGGVQMYDIPQIITNGQGNPNRTSMTVVMYLNNQISVGKNYGKAGTISVVLFIVAAVLSLGVAAFNSKDQIAEQRAKKLKKKKLKGAYKI